MAPAQRRSARRLAPPLACVAAILVLAAPALASPGWTPSIDYSLPPGASPASARIQFQGGGIATVAYLDSSSALHVGTVFPGEGYQEQMSLPSTTTAVPDGVALAVAPDGAAVLEYSERGGTDPSSSPVTYVASYRAAGSSTWGTPVMLASDASPSTGITPLLVPAISADGSAAAAVDHPDPTLSPAGNRIDVIVRPAGANSWSGPAQLAAGSGQSAENVALAFDAEGDLTAAFDLQIGNGGYTLADQQLAAGSAAWSSVEDIAGSTPGATAGPPQLAVAPDGSAVLAFAYGPAGTPSAEAVTRSGAGSAWTAPASLTAPGTDSSPAAAGISPLDLASVLLDEQPSGGGSCAAATQGQPGAGFTTPTCLSASEIGSPLAGGISFIGNDAYFAWSGPEAATGTNVVEGTSWPAAASAPGGATTLASPAPALTFAELTPDGDGSVAAFWTAGTGDGLTTSAFDAAGPVLIASDVPAHAYVQQDFGMNATFADLWSGVTAIPTWSFGDGTTGTGAQVAHAYPKPGTYTATVTATDGLGNPTTASFTIGIVPRPPAPPKPPKHPPPKPARRTHVHTRHRSRHR